MTCPIGAEMANLALILNERGCAVSFLGSNHHSDQSQFVLLKCIGYLFVELDIISICLIKIWKVCKCSLNSYR